jgi:hypothetical protein
MGQTAQIVRLPAVIDYGFGIGPHRMDTSKGRSCLVNEAPPMDSPPDFLDWATPRYWKRWGAGERLDALLRQTRDLSHHMQVPWIPVSAVNHQGILQPPES